MISSKLIASLRVEAFNFYDYDFYEPTYFCLTPVEEYKSYECQLKVVFQLVKPSSIFVYPKNVDVTSVQPIAYQIEVQNANLNVSLFILSNPQARTRRQEALLLLPLEHQFLCVC